ncbi:nuclear factor 7, brain-like, partial [Conger conger]|uniref:nuclear factor 7, brain-like n=1 Tax=Conger conger TaxID=82655 RepID=UPI002A59C4A7
MLKLFKGIAGLLRKEFEELKPAVNLIKEKLKTFTENEQECKKTAEHIRSQTQHTEGQIKADFEKLHQFLREEEEARLAVLKKEGEVKSRVMEEKLADITRHISTLTDKITTIEKAMDTEDTSFLKSYKNIKDRYGDTHLISLSESLLSLSLTDSCLSLQSPVHTA